MKNFTYQPCLFPVIPDPTPTTTHKKLRRIYPLLWQAIHDSFEDVRRRRETDPSFRHRTEGELAWWLRPEIVYRAKQLFDGYEGVRWSKARGLWLLIWKEEIAICFKKLRLRKLNPLQLRAELTRSNAETGGNLDFWSQREMQGYPSCPRIIIGYLPKKEFTEIKIIVAHPRERHLGFRWHYDMPDQRRKVLRLAEARQEPAAEEAAKGFVVKPVETKEGTHE